MPLSTPACARAASKSSLQLVLALVCRRALAFLLVQVPQDLKTPLKTRATVPKCKKQQRDQLVKIRDGKVPGSDPPAVAGLGPR